MFYDKKIKYVDVFDGEEKVQNAGFARLEARDGEASVQIKLSGLRHTDVGNCRVLMVGNEREAALGDILLEAGRGMCEYKELKREALVEGIAYEALEEIRIKLPRGVTLRCIIRERKRAVEPAVKEEEISAIDEEETSVADAEPMQEKEIMRQETEAMLLEKETMRQETEAELSEAELLKQAFQAEKILRESEAEERFQKEQEEKKSKRQEEKILERQEVFVPAANKWQQLWSLYPHIRPFEDEREYLRIKPQDFVVLSQKCYELSSNSFLLHGYYNYEHLILARERKENKVHFYIGVPGNFYDKEKQVAILFGFESFEGKVEPAGYGDFGYYMVSVEI